MRGDTGTTALLVQPVPLPSPLLTACTRVAAVNTHNAAVHPVLHLENVRACVVPYNVSRRGAGFIHSPRTSRCRASIQPRLLALKEPQR